MGILKYLILVWLTMILESYTFESAIQAIFPYKDEHECCCEECCDGDSDSDTSNTTSEEDTDNLIEQNNNVESNGIVIYSGKFKSILIFEIYRVIDNK